MHSLSDDDSKIAPRSIRSRRSAAALVRLPLCAIAARPSKTRRRRAARRGSRCCPSSRRWNSGHGRWQGHAGQHLHHVGLGEIVADVAEAAGVVEAFVFVMGDDAAGLLPAVLKCMQAKGHEICRVGNADHAKNAALLLQLVVVEGVGKEAGHRQGLRIRVCLGPSFSGMGGRCHALPFQKLSVQPPDDGAVSVLAPVPVSSDGSAGARGMSAPAQDDTSSSYLRTTQPGASVGICSFSRASKS